MLCLGLYVAGPLGPRLHSGVSVVLHFSQIKFCLDFLLPRLRFRGFFISSSETKESRGSILGVDCTVTVSSIPQLEERTLCDGRRWLEEKADTSEATNKGDEEEEFAAERRGCIEGGDSGDGGDNGKGETEERRDEAEAEGKGTDESEGEGESEEKDVCVCVVCVDEEN
jgi:hypothetical protein